MGLKRRDDALHVGKVGHEDLSLEDMIERGAGGFEGLFEVAEDVVRLQLDVGTVKRKRRIAARLRRHAGLVVAGDLAGGEHPVADLEAFVVIGERSRRARFDGFDLHHCLQRFQTTPSDGNRGGRFSRSAATPSGSSAPEKPRNSMPSEASKIGPAARIQLLSAYLVQRIAFGAPSASRTATSSARVCSSASGTASETRPMRSASSPVTGSPNSTRDVAFAQPQN